MKIWSIPADMKERVKNDGFAFCEKIIDDSALEEVRREIEIWTRTPAINGVGCIFHSGDALLQNAGLYSGALLQLALSDGIIDFMEDFLGQKVILDKIEYRKSLDEKEEMEMHSDNTDIILIFIYLSGVSDKMGATACIPGTQSLGTSLNNGYLQIPKDQQNLVEDKLVVAEGGAGCCLIFDPNIWHKRTKTVIPGREILWLGYRKVDFRDRCSDMAFSRSTVNTLAPKQIERLGIGLSAVGSKPTEDFRITSSRFADATYFISDGEILRTLMRRQYRRLVKIVPSSVKTWLKILIGYDFKKDFKKVA